MQNILAISFLIFLLTITGCDKKTDDSNAKGSTESLSDKASSEKAPDFTLTTVDNKTIKLSDYKGKIVIIDFWATWCPPCRKGIPDLIEIQNRYKKDVIVIGLSVDTDTKGEVVPFISNNGINYPVAYPTPDVVSSYGGIESIPTSFIIDQNGTVIDKNVGLVPMSNITSTIDRLLKK